MVISETTVRPMDGAVEHPRTDLLCVGELMPWQASMSGDQQTLNSKKLTSYYKTENCANSAEE
ncbi:hypothetical protein FAP94_18175 [Morganella morganii]|nr:hypothetical protein [Morganella morganii]